MRAKVKIYPSAAGYNLAAAGYDKKEKYLDSFEKGKVMELLGDIGGRKILDAGAGTGRLAAAMAKAGAEVFALDVSEKMLKVIKQKSPRLQTFIGDAGALPFADNSFDWVVAAFLVVHLQDPAKFFDEAYRVLKDGGRLLVTNINQKEPPEIRVHNDMIKIESYYHRPEKIRKIISSLAFVVEKEVFIEEDNTWINQIIVAKK
jgi:ubiquinone/menaquinone biosynthesis C-methylase UbiE